MFLGGPPGLQWSGECEGADQRHSYRNARSMNWLHSSLQSEIGIKAVDVIILTQMRLLPKDITLMQ